MDGDALVDIELDHSIDDKGSYFVGIVDVDNGCNIYGVRVFRTAGQLKPAVG